MPFKHMRMMGAHFNEPNKVFLISIEVESMSCDPPMNQKEIIASISFYKIKHLIVSYYNEQHLFIPCLFELFAQTIRLRKDNSKIINFRFPSVFASISDC